MKNSYEPQQNISFGALILQHIEIAQSRKRSVQINSPERILSNVTAMSAGGSHGMAIKTDNSLWGWGNGAIGQWGNGRLNPDSPFDYNSYCCSNVPIQVLTGVKLPSVWPALLPLPTPDIMDLFNMFFSNDVMTFSLGQQGSFEQIVRITARLCPALNTDNLAIYVYCRETNTFRLIPMPNIFVDENEYVHFDTIVGGDIIISDGLLTRL